MKRILRSAIAFILLVSVLVLSLSGCAMTISAECLSDGFTPREIEDAPELSLYAAALSDFALRLYAGSLSESQNSVISPTSVLIALAMAANGADGETLSEMEEVLGVPTNEVSLYLSSYLSYLNSSTDGQISIANSLWLKDFAGFLPNGDFLQRNADYFGADIYKAPFDASTLRDINNWVKRETDGTIPKMLDKIGDYTVAYLINALAFEAEWSEVYKEHQVRDGVFRNASGGSATVDFMHSTEGKYIENELATGFMKGYKGGNYSFVALLPKEGVSTRELVEAMSGEELYALLSAPEYTSVVARMPKFEAEFSIEMSELLSDMGMPLAFDPDFADFSRLGEMADGENLFISSVLHKAYISVGEKGTKAGAATVIAIDGATAGDPSMQREVILDRPFVYMLIDNESRIPFFIGSVNELG